jgi:uncharacterized membrane protein
MVWTWAIIATMDPRATASHALREDPRRRLAQTIVIVASIASLGGVGYLLVAGAAAGGDATAATVVGILSVITSWLAVHTVFTLRYAGHYYTEPVGGVDFNQDDEPSYADFAYLAFTIGMTFQVSDTPVQARTIRVGALQQAILSYLLGAVILAITLNLVANLGGSSS